jgi:hypothetical protein
MSIKINKIGVSELCVKQRLLDKKAGEALQMRMKQNYLPFINI